MICDSVTRQQVGCWLGTGREANGGVNLFFCDLPARALSPPYIPPSGGTAVRAVLRVWGVGAGSCVGESALAVLHVEVGYY